MTDVDDVSVVRDERSETNETSAHEAQEPREDRGGAAERPPDPGVAQPALYPLEPWLDVSGADGGAAWASAPELLPDEWPEKEHAFGPRLEEGRSAALRFASRRRREPESETVLAEEPLPRPHERVVLEWRGERPAVPMPAGAPEGPIAQAQLFIDSRQVGDRWRSQDLDRVDAWIACAKEAARSRCERERARRKVQACERCIQAEERPLAKARLTVQLRALKDELRAVQVSKPPEEVLTIGQDRLSVWARGFPWCCRNPLDCKPLQPSSAEDPPPCEVNREFFAKWADKLGWRDEDMLGQVRSGVDSRSQCELAIVLRWHHKGLERNIRASARLPLAPCASCVRRSCRVSHARVAFGPFSRERLLV